MFERYTTSVVTEREISTRLLDDILAATAGYRMGSDGTVRSDNADNINIRKDGIIKKAYCMKCRHEAEIRNPREVYTRNGKPAVEGICSICGTRVYRIGRK